MSYELDPTTLTTDAFGLPTSQPMSRESFSLPDFDADSFLSAHHHYQTLDDLHLQLQQWAHRLDSDLMDLINRDYPHFVALGQSLAAGRSSASDMRLETSSFNSHVAKSAAVLNNNLTRFNELTTTHSHLTSLQALVNKLVLYHHKLADTETRLQTKPTSAVELTELAASALVLERLRMLLPSDHPFVQAQHSRLLAIRSQVKALLSAGVMRSTDLDKWSLFLLYQRTNMY